MHGHAFQVYGEQKKQGQFKDSINMMKIYASQEYEKEIGLIGCLFEDDIKEPQLDEPMDPTGKGSGGTLAKTQEKKLTPKLTYT